MIIDAVRTKVVAFAEGVTPHGLENFLGGAGVKVQQVGLAVEETGQPADGRNPGGAPIQPVSV